MSRARVAFLLFVACQSCAPLLPEQGNARALVLDMRRIVDARGQLGWMLDELEVQAVLPDAMASACRVEAATREEALRWLDAQINRQGGPPSAAFTRAGRDLDAIEDLLLLTRARLVLGEAHRWAQQGKCPFWIEPEPAFTGVQGFARKLILSLETGARFYVQTEGKELGFGGAGTMRLLSGFGLSDRLTLLAGIEAGGAARFTDVSIGRRTEVPAVLVFGSLPLVLRGHWISDHAELDLGPVAYFNQLRGRVQTGLRVGAGVGVSRLRLRGILPGVSFSVSYDFIPEQGGLPEVHQLGAGLRGAFSITP